MKGIFKNVWNRKGQFSSTMMAIIALISFVAALVIMIMILTKQPLLS